MGRFALMFLISMFWSPSLSYKKHLERLRTAVFDVRVKKSLDFCLFLFSSVFFHTILLLSP